MALLAAKVNPRTAFVKQLWEENCICRQVLGICSALAVTNLMFNTLLMCVGLIWTVVMTNITVSLLRNYTPQRVRMMVQVLIISCYVIIVDVTLRATFFEIHKMIGPYVGLIITNCIIMGRAEGFAMHNRPWPSLLDGIGNGLGYAVILLITATVRELLGSGRLFGVVVLKPISDGGWYAPNGLMLLAPAAFFIIGAIIWVLRAWKPEQAEVE